MRLLPMGPLAVLIDGLDDPAGWATSFRRIEPGGVVDVVPAARTVLVITQSEEAAAAVVAVAPDVAGHAFETSPPEHVSVPVVYDGPDLADVARATGLGLDDVVAAHSGAAYRVEFCGFAPGFAYLSGLPLELHLPRRTTPRTRVPAGSVAIASEYSAVYPTTSPGGWHLIGSTDVTLFDAERRPPALLAPGTTVTFVAT